MTEWLATDVDKTMQIGHACIVEAETVELAAALAADWFAEDFQLTEPPHTLKVLPWPDPDYYRITYGAERVPDEFQCCGGMPRLDGPGTDDKHTAICTKSSSDRQEEPM